MNFIKSALGLPWLVCAARLVYMSRLYRKTSAERLSLVQVSWIKPIIRPIPEDLSRKPRPEMHFGAQARLVHHGIIWKRAKEPQLINYSLSLSSTSSMIKPLHPNPFTGGIYREGKERRRGFLFAPSYLKTRLTSQQSITTNSQQLMSKIITMG